MRFQFLLGEIGNGLRRNLSMAVSVVIVTMISMYLLGLGLMGQRQVDTMKDYWYDRVQVTVLLCAEKTRFTNCAGEPTTDAQRTAIKAELEALKPTVKEVFYESRDEAFDRFKQTYKNSPLARAGESYFADSYRVNLNDAEQVRRRRELDQGHAGRRRRPGPEEAPREVLHLHEHRVVGGDRPVARSWSSRPSCSSPRRSARPPSAGAARPGSCASSAPRTSPSASRSSWRPSSPSVLGAGLAMGMLWATVRYGVVGFLSQTLTDTAFIGVRGRLLRRARSSSSASSGSRPSRPG